MKFLEKVVAAVSTAACATAIATAPAAHADPTPGQYSRYVAIGDSYASVGTLTDTNWLDRPLCGRANDNYPRQLAGRLGLNGSEQFVDATCGWAKPEDYWGPQHFPVYNTNPYTQRDSITPDTDLVTVTFGGNPTALEVAKWCIPSGFGLNGEVNALDIAANYPPAIAAAVSQYKDWVKQFNISCSNAAGDVARINQNRYGEYRAIIDDIKQRAPQAEIRVVGYFDVIGDPEALCLDLAGLSLADRQYIKDYIAGLNGIARQVAEDTGTVYVDPSVGGSGVCGPHGAREASALGIFDNAVPYHPTGNGQTRTADAVFRSL